MRLRAVILPLAVGALSACRRAEPSPTRATDDAGATTSAPSAKPPPVAARRRGMCPLAIEPGVALGPIAVGSSLPALEDAGLVVTRFAASKAELVFPGDDGPGVALHVSLCRGEVTQIWVDDLGRAPDCVTIDGERVAMGTQRSELERRLGCAKGGGEAVSRCREGGVYVGGEAASASVRVSRRDVAFSSACPDR